MKSEFEPLAGESGPLQQAQVPLAGMPINRSRRRLVSGVASGAGVLLSVQAKTALGSTVCQSPSAAISGNTSPRPGGPTSCTGGRSPGFWKVPQHFNSWRGVTPATFKPSADIQPCASGLEGVKLSDIVLQGSTPSELGLSPIPSAVGIYGVWAILAFPKNFGTLGQPMRHLLSAYLNAKLWPSDYPISLDEVKRMWTAVVNSQLYCPGSLSCSNASMWTPTQVIKYITDLYDFNELEVELCTATVS